jgi:hypothetical protein
VFFFVVFLFVLDFSVLPLSYCGLYGTFYGRPTALGAASAAIADFALQSRYLLFKAATSDTAAIADFALQSVDFALQSRIPPVLDGIVSPASKGG